jgi:YidC/Oxa1 family membrane protein insertase
MEKRVLLAIFLAFLVLYAWNALFAPPPPETPPQRASAPAVSKPVEPTKPASQAELPPEPPAAAPLVGENSEHDVRIETRDVVAVFTNRGARLKSWRLKGYHDRTGAPVELVAHDTPATQALPFSLRVPDEALSKTLNNALFTVNGTPSNEGAITAPTELKFEYRDSAGLQAVKQFRFEPASYVIGFSATVAQGDRQLTTSIDWGPGLGDPDPGSTRASAAARGLFAIGNKVTRLTASDVAKQVKYSGGFQYAGVDDHYFMTVALATGPSTITFQSVSVPPPSGDQATARQLMAYTLDPAPGRSPLRFYFGPKHFDALAAVDRDLVRAIDFGMFAIIVVPLLRTLNWIYGYIGNYGWAIVVLSVIINLLIFPLRHKQVVSMRKMQEIQPEVKTIQERYAKLKATDPAKQKMNQELMALYRERGVNPAAGCVPVLLPLPVFFAFYALLGGAIELRGAPFVGWIHDMSLPDPYYVLPIFMVVTQVIQTWMMPAAGTDPTQQKMMMVMPIVLGFIFITMPAGVVIYWVVNNIWGIGQQLVTNKLIGPPNVRTPRPPAERRVKRVGSGKTDAARDN